MRTVALALALCFALAPSEAKTRPVHLRPAKASKPAKARKNSKVKVRKAPKHRSVTQRNTVN